MVKHSDGNEKTVKAFRVTRMLVDAYINAESDGGSVDWSDIDAAHALALEIYGVDTDDQVDKSAAVVVPVVRDVMNVKGEPDIAKLMELSPLHLSRAEYQGLGIGAVEGLTVYPFAYGYLLFVPEGAHEIALLPKQEDGGPSDELIALMMYASEREVEWIKFDRDVNPVSLLPVFEDGWI